MTPIGVFGGILISVEDAAEHVLFYSFIYFFLKYDIFSSPFLDFFFDVDGKQEENQVGDEETDLAAAEVLWTENFKTNESLIIIEPLRKNILE